VRPARTLEVALAPAEATVGENEDTAMPANYRQEDRAQPPPENPPEGVRTYPATTIQLGARAKEPEIPR
jgi:hypothetical protein